MTELDPYFLSVEQVIAIHEEQLAIYGGVDGIRDRGALESAVNAPQSTFGGEFLYGDLMEMAGVYAFGIAECQAFLDGNKRTDANTALTFLEINGVLVVDPGNMVYNAMIAIGKKAMGRDGLVNVLRRLPLRTM